MLTVLRALVIAASLVLFSAATVAAQTAPTAPPGDQPADICLSVATSAIARDAWGPITDAVDLALEARPVLVSEPARIASGIDGIGSDQVATILIWASPDPAVVTADPADCLEPGAEWAAQISRDFLGAGADRLLAQAPTTPGIDSNVEVQWHPDEVRVRTWLEFEGPFGIPNGTCWIDDVLDVGESGSAVTSTDTGVKTSPFAESACRRFFDFLTAGGAGEQAITLLPAEVNLGDGRALRFAVLNVRMDEDAIVISGEVEAR